jgi:hypothetical protein
MSRLRLAILLAALIAAFATVTSVASAVPSSATAVAAKAPAKSAAPAAAPASDKATQGLVQMADEVAKEVETLRGWKFKQPVKKQLCTPEQARAYLDKEIEKQIPNEKVRRSQAFLRMVGLLPAGCDLKKTFLDIMQSQVGGFYDTDTKTLYMVTRSGAKIVPLVERTMIAHELTHALDDQYADLGKFVAAHTGESEDMDLATTSVFEGSATALMTQYMTQATLAGKIDLTELQEYAVQETARSQPLLKAPRYFLAMMGAYICGTQFLARGNIMTLMLSADNSAVGRNFLEAVKSPPQSTRQILHPEKYWDPATRDDPILVNDDDAARLLAKPGRFIVHKDTVGEMLCSILGSPTAAKPAAAMPKGSDLGGLGGLEQSGGMGDLSDLQSADAWIKPASKGWNGDRFYLLASGASVDDAGKTLKDAKGVWLTFWESPQSRDAFVAAYAAGDPVAGRTVGKLGSMGAAFFYGFTDAERQALLAALEKTPPKMTRGGKPWTM